MRVTELSTLKADCFHLSEKDPTTTFITVKTSYNKYDKLKDTKTYKARTATDPTTLCNEILDYLGWNPDGFIFGSIVKREVPINSTNIVSASFIVHMHLNTFCFFYRIIAHMFKCSCIE